MNQQLPKTDIVLLGAGHTHAHVLRMWRMAPIDDARLTLVSNFPIATYSGMLPGTLAGLYNRERMQIDLVRLCASAGVRLIVDDVSHVDPESGRIHFARRPSLRFDVLSLGVGSQPKHDGVCLDHSVVLVKPMQTFIERLDSELTRFRDEPHDRPLRIAVVGGGAGGIEVAFCLPAHLARLLPGRRCELSLVDANQTLAQGLPAGVSRLARRELDERGVKVLLQRKVERVSEGRIEFDDGAAQPADVVIWATGAAAPPLLARTGLPVNDQGFLRTQPTLKTIADAPIFAVGDCGSIEGHAVPKAGVYAVRQGPILWGNLHRQVFGRPLLEYQPQRGFLSLLATGDRRAILGYKGLAFQGGWCWRLKDRIDSRFMDKYQDYSPMSPMPPDGATQAAPVMRCQGCGGKVGGAVLSQVLSKLEVPASPHVVLGLDRPDDAAILRPPAGRLMTATVDFFASFLDDPYLVGRVAALNAASDLFAMGSRPWGALAMATVPPGPERQQEELLYELMAGGLHELRNMGATLIGGHSIEGPTIAVGYSMLAEATSASPRTKGNLREGDRLVLTKPLGSGILLAAWQQARCRAEWFGPLVEMLLTSNQGAAQLADEFDIAAMTDVTGFGLAGHLMEMLSASNHSAELKLEAIALLPGVEPLVRAGVESTLAPANRAVERSIDVSAAARQNVHYAALFDPQTSGGLLLAVPERHAADLLERLSALSHQPPAEIGRVVALQTPEPRIHIV